MTRRWTSNTNIPLASDVEYTPPEDCCFDATDVQEAIDQLLRVNRMVAIRMDGDGVTSICDLVEWEAGDIKYFTKQVI